MSAGSAGNAGDFIKEGWTMGEPQRMPPSISGLPPIQLEILGRKIVVPRKPRGVTWIKWLARGIQERAHCDEVWTIKLCNFHPERLGTWEELEMAMQEAREERRRSFGVFVSDGWKVGEVPTVRKRTVRR